MYKVPSSETPQSIFERHPRRIRWGIFWLLFFLFIYIFVVYINVSLNTMTYRDADRAAWAEYARRIVWGYDGDRLTARIFSLIWLGLMISPLFHRSIIRKTWFLKGITVATLLFVSYILISMPTYW